MAFNLLTTPWLEVRRKSGVREILRPCDITSHFADDPVVALDFPRADWNAGVLEFLIGLMAIAFPVDRPRAWAERYRNPPDPAAIEAALAPFITAFDLDGDGPVAFQDHDPLGNAELKPLSALLIDAPGENTLKNNADLFNKRGGAEALCLAYAAAALITLQTYAPSGGAGHRTSMRGGGPLTTLIAPQRAESDVPGLTLLWDVVWANVPNADAATCTAEPDELFPWLKPTIVSDKGKIVTPDDRPAALAFFACPRRIRLTFADDGVCALSGAHSRVATGFRTVNYGANYAAWEHPLSPYRQDKKAGKLPIHPHAGPSDYGDWIAWWGLKGAGDQKAEPVHLWEKRRLEVGAPQAGISAFGYDMDNMKARQWLQTRLPWLPVHGEAGDSIQQLVTQAVAAAEESARALRYAAKLATYGQRSGDGYRLPETLPLDAVQEPGFRFWRETEAPFRNLLEGALRLMRDGPRPSADLKLGWRETLKKNALRIFDETVDLDGLTDEDPRRLLYARQGLGFAFADHAKAEVSKALELATLKPPRKSKKEAA